ncbi:MAG: hypothetical protein AAFQ61_13595 [Cyanobacteria bacterium J06626_23]
MDEGTFYTRLTNPKIVLHDEFGVAAIYFDDSDMFAGHSFEVFIDEDSIADALMAG